MLTRITEAMVRVEFQRAFRCLHPEEYPGDPNDVPALHIPEYQPNTLTASFRAECAFAGAVLAIAIKNRSERRLLFCAPSVSIDVSP